MPISRIAIGHHEPVPEGDGQPFEMRVDACFTATRAGEPTDVQLILSGEVVHGVSRSGDALVVTHDGKRMPARCVGVLMSNPIGLIVSGIEKFDPVAGDSVSAVADPP